MSRPPANSKDRPDVLRTALIQQSAGIDPQTNVDRCVEAIRAAAAGGAGLVCLQELFRSRYFCQTQDAAQFHLAEPIPGPTTDRLGSLARELGVVIAASLFERRSAGVYHNTLVVLESDGRLVHRYRKMHIPEDPSFEEKYYFTPGDTGFTVADTSVGRIGTLVCWDQWYPEAARLAALRGAEILVYPTAIGWLAAERDDLGEAQYEAWETVQRSHAIANGLFVAAINRIGVEDAIEFWGGSFVADPLGRVVGRASRSDEETLIVDCDLREIETVRRDWPFLRDRRIDAYGGLERRFLDEEPGDS